jgi:glycosyltransferase involved in cell wall biosynthesis
VPTVSVIIPAFNAEAFIGEAIDSALQQSFTDLEVLVVDNRSTDGTGDIARQFDDSRVRLLKCEKRGAGAARNAGLQHVSGRFIQFLDADDVLDTTNIERQLDAIGTIDPRWTIASCTWLRFKDHPDDARLHTERVWPIEDSVKWLVCSLSGGGMMQTGGWLVHRDLIEAAGPWDETLSLHDDGEYFSRVLLLARRQVFVPKARIYYRDVAGSLSRQRDRAAIESAFKVCCLRDRHLLDVVDTCEARQAIATQHAQFAYEFSSAAPDLAGQALRRIAELGERPINSIGGPGFRRLTKIVGFPFALGTRRSIKLLMQARD